MNLFHLRYFVKLAEIQHYTKAARELCITQPSLSHAIMQLENELGVPLFEKNKRAIVLTRFGEEFLDCARRTLETLDFGIHSLQRAARGEGEIRLGLLRILGREYIPRLASQFLLEHPDREIHFSFHTGVTQELLDGLHTQKYDLIFCSKPVFDLNLTAVPLEKQDLVLITPRNHPLANVHTVNLEQILPYPQVYFSKGSGLRDVVDAMFSNIHRTPHIAFETEEDEVIAGLVAQGFGIAIVPYMDLLLKLNVKLIQISDLTVERNIYMVHDESVFMPPVVSAFREFILNSRLK